MTILKRKCEQFSFFRSGYADNLPHN